MLFNSIDFAIFLPIVFILYWFVFSFNTKVQNTLIFISSYVFYGWWDWRFLSLIFFSSLVDYLIGILLSKSNEKINRKLLLLTSILINLGLLGFFKYFNFFSETFAEAFTLLGGSFQPARLNIILPVGISFYTFQTLSYTIDVYKKKLEPTKDIIAFFSFVSFFPQLVAGPIERASNLLPQFYFKRKFEYKKAVDGMRQILWGLFKKVVIADNCAVFADEIFNNYHGYSGSTLIMGAVYFTFQIYGDFSGYSDIAIGTSRLFGFNLKQNFAFPYFSRDIAEFWRRWHISLSTWFRDYLYIPLGGSRGGTWMKIRNTFIIFTVSGFWHGANWTFIVWGALNAIFFLPLLITNNNRNNLGTVAHNRTLPSIKEFSNILFTFGLTVFAWIFFRSENISHALNFILKIFSYELFYVPKILDETTGLMITPKTMPMFIAVFTLIEWCGRNDQFAIEKTGLKWNSYMRYIFYSLICVSVLWYSQGVEKTFIYFQF